jgi:aldose 1-epimerase
MLRTITTEPLSGIRIDLAGGGYTAEIATVGATLRRLRAGERDLIVPFAEDEVRPFFRGAILAPWPNRVVDGTYTFDGEAQQLALTEPARGHALHGLVGWADFDVVEHGDDHVELRTVIPAQLGYPHRVEVTVVYRLGAGGLSTTVRGTNTGPTPAPWGTGPHPYLVAGPGHVDDWTLTVPADTVLTVSEERLLPTGSAPVATEDGGTFDFRRPRLIADTFVDHAYTDVLRDADGTAEVRVTATDGSGTAISWGTDCGWVQVHTGDRPEAWANRVGLAVEPMTCPPDAFNSGEGLVVLQPDASSDASWTIRALPAEGAGA